MRPLFPLLLAVVLGGMGCADGRRLPVNVECGDPLPERFGRCEAPMWVVDEQNACTGYVRCADGALNRVTAMRVDPANTGSCPDRAVEIRCGADGACGSRDPNTRCVGSVDLSSGEVFCDCVSSCSTDADCQPDGACIPDALNGQQLHTSQCAWAACTVSADCPSGECGLSVNVDDSTQRVELACRTQDDQCPADHTSDADTLQSACIVGEGAAFAYKPEEESDI